MPITWPKCSECGHIAQEHNTQEDVESGAAVAFCGPLKGPITCTCVGYEPSGPTKKIKKCDICLQDPKVNGATFVDGKTFRGPWANMCEKCFKLYGVGLGLGLGQRYDIITGACLEGSR